MIKRLVIHTCCADCFLNTVQNLESKNLIDEDTEIVSFYFNPNIHPRSEYLERMKALKEVINTLKERNIKLIVPNYQPSQWVAAVKGYEDNKNLSRCNRCWEMRLEALFNYAKENNIDTVTTTLLTSHYQNKVVINQIAQRLSKKYNISFLEIDSSSNCKHHGFYKQNYCGCCFSLTEKMI